MYSLRRHKITPPQKIDDDHATANQTTNVHIDDDADEAPQPRAGAAAAAADALEGLVDLVSAAGAHALRSAARVKALARVVATRFDTEGFNADVEAGSSPAWKRFVAALPLEERTLLRIFRCGAIRTPTKRLRDMEMRACPFCMFPNASARHYWQECDRFKAIRIELEAEF